MGWYERLQSVRREMEGDGTSDLQRETGVSVRTWGGHVYRYVAELADQFDHGPLALVVIQHYALVSAIYEWAAINEVDLALDRPAFFAYWGGARSSPSIGTFQGYPERGAWALANDASLRAFVLRDPQTRERRWAGLSWDEIDRPQVVQGRVPGPEGTYDSDHWVGLAWDSAGEDALDMASDPFFSLIGKVQLSMTCVQEVVQLMAREYRGRLPPQLERRTGGPATPQSSDPLALWLLAMYEFGDHDAREVRKNLDKLVHAVEHPGRVFTLNPIADVEKPRAAFRAVGIQFAETFSYDDGRQVIRPLVSAPGG